MPANEGRSPYEPSQQGYGYQSSKPQVIEETLMTDKVQIERKSFVFTLKENPRGRFLRITEDVNGRRDTIIIPATGLDDFRRALEGMVAASSATPLPPPQD